MSDARYQELYRRSMDEPEVFWGELAQSIHWHRPYDRVLNYDRPPFARWFEGGQTNLCYNAVDRHLATRPDQAALIYVSTESDVERTYTYRQLYEEVNSAAAMLKAMGIGRGDRVLIYMPMIPQAVFAMLACVRVGAIHSVVFGGFAAASLSTRIDDARPDLVISADAGSRAGKVISYKPLLDEAIRLAKHPPRCVLLFDRGLAKMERVNGRDADWEELSNTVREVQVPCVWLDSTESSYILYTSGTTGRPKGVQRDTGGYAVALAASMPLIFGGNAGETYFSTSDIGWVVGHSYIVYAPLIAGMATVLYEGLPIRPDGGIWWRLVEKYKVSVMFSAPTAIRVLKKQDPSYLTRYDLSSLRSLFLAGEPLDEPTARWIADGIGRPIIDNYWQTETGWPILATLVGADPEMKPKFGSPGKPVYGYRMLLRDELSGEPVSANQKAVLAIEGPLPPGCMVTVWDDDERFVSTYWSQQGEKWFYSSFDWGIVDEEGYWFILGRTDDVINVAGHRLGTREIEESVNRHPEVAESAVVGVEDALKGQVAIAFAIVRNPQIIETLADRLKLEGEVMGVVDRQLGSIGRPARVHFVTALPKTRSGKMLRRAIQAICEGRDPGDLTTIEDPAALDQIRSALAPTGRNDA
jgi:propionyl-CoA synthetase